MDGSSYRRRRAAYLKVDIADGNIQGLDMIPIQTTDELCVDYPDDKVKIKMMKSLSSVGEKIEKHSNNYEKFYKQQYNKEIVAHSFSTLLFLYRTKGVGGLFKTLIVRNEDVMRILKWSVSDRSKVQSDTDALEVKTVLTEKDIYGEDYD